jgi:transcriptional regulator with XRE-family HTH domain
MESFETVTTYSAIVGSILAQERISKRLNQGAIAEAVGVGTSTWSRIEKGESSISVDQLKLAAEALQQTPGRILDMAAEAERAIASRGIRVNNRMTSGALLATMGIIPLIGPVLGGIIAASIAAVAAQRRAGQQSQAMQQSDDAAVK